MPAPAPYPVQPGLTTAMRFDAQKSGDVQRMQAWAGQSAALVENMERVVIGRVGTGISDPRLQLLRAP